MRRATWWWLMGGWALVGALVVVPVAAQEAPLARPGQADPLDPSGLGRLSPTAPGQVDSGTAFNPRISVILDGLYYGDDARGEGEARIDAAAGFGDGHGHGHGHGHDHGLDRGFNLRETEITFQATVDPYFDALAVVTVEGTDEIDLEEAYGVSRGLPAGLQVKFGRFLSDIGYMNRQHLHEFQFVDRPLFNRLFFGDHGLQETGVQLAWLAPTPVYTRFGVEVLQGDNERLVGDAGDERAGPRLVTAFAKLAPDLGYDHALQLGLFGGYTPRYETHETHSSGRTEDGDGRTWFAGTDWVYKYDAGRAYGAGNLQLVAEYIYRERRYDFVETQPDGTVSIDERLQDRQDGAYVEGVYGIAPRWRAGLRYDAVGFTNRLGDDAFDRSERYTANVTWLPTEFSRLRLEFARNRIAEDDHDHGGRAYFNQFFLQYQLSLGVHGAHAF